MFIDSTMKKNKHIIIRDKRLFVEKRLTLTLSSFATRSLIDRVYIYIYISYISLFVTYILYVHTTCNYIRARARVWYTYVSIYIFMYIRFYYVLLFWSIFISSDTTHQPGLNWVQLRRCFFFSLSYLLILLRFFLFFFFLQDD